MPHSGSAESGWLDEEAFRTHFGTEWKEKWETAESKRLPKKSKFREFYGARVWKQHWQWHQEDDDATLLSTRVPRPRNVIDYDVLLSALQDEELDYGDSVDEQTWMEGDDGDDNVDSGSGDVEDEDWSN